MKQEKVIRLTEQDLHMLVEDTVKIYLTENDVEEGVWSGLKNAGRSLFNGNFRNLGTAYSQGSWAGSIQKYLQSAQTGLDGMYQIMYKSGDQEGAQVVAQIKQNLEQVAKNYQDIATNTSNKASMRQNMNQQGQQNQNNTQNNGQAGENVASSAVGGQGQGQVAVGAENNGMQQNQQAAPQQQQQGTANRMYNNANRLRQGLGAQQQQQQQQMGNDGQTAKQISMNPSLGNDERKTVGV